MFGLSHVELMFIGIAAVLLFGSRLPSVARSMGKSFTEFKKGLRGIEDDIDTSSSSGRRVTSSYAEDREEATAPKFEPPKSEPTTEAATEATVEQETAEHEAVKTAP
jgi:sec-independent protein translocase protein TatA